MIIFMFSSSDILVCNLILMELTKLLGLDPKLVHSLLLFSTKICCSLLLEQINAFSIFVISLNS